MVRDLGSDDFDLPFIDDSFTYSGSIGSNTQVEEEGDSELSIKVHNFDEYATGGRSPLASTGHVAVSDDDNGDRSGEQPLVRHNKGMDYVSPSFLAVVLASGEASSRRVLKRSHSLDHNAFSSFCNSLCVGCPYAYITQLNVDSPPHDVNVHHPSNPIYVSS